MTTISLINTLSHFRCTSPPIYLGKLYYIYTLDIIILYYTQQGISPLTYPGKLYNIYKLDTIILYYNQQGTSPSTYTGKINHIIFTYTPYTIHIYKL